MPAPRYRSRTLRRVHVRTPGGTSKIQYRKRNPKVAKCSKCEAKLKGVPRGRPYKLMQMAKTKKRPERPYGGILCSKCLKKLMIDRARKEK
jgi:large subunit ribosomal protein L34e